LEFSINSHGRNFVRQIIILVTYLSFELDTIIQVYIEYIGTLPVFGLNISFTLIVYFVVIIFCDWYYEQALSLLKRNDLWSFSASEYVP